MTMPNFLIIGAAKAGTTSLAQYLKQHPQVYISPVKEPYFFSLEGQKRDFQGPGDPETFAKAVTNLEDYQNLFAGVAGEVAIGEASVSYLHTPLAAKRIYKYLPNVKLIVILRNPVDRAYACFMHQIREGHEPFTDFAQALAQEEKRIQENWMFLWHYQQNGFYYAQLKPYYNLFNRSQIKIYLYEDLQNDAATLVRDIFNFIEVDQNFVPDLSIRYNMSGVPKSWFVQNLLTKSNPIKYILRPLFPQKLRQIIRKQNLAKPELPGQIRKELSQGYRDDILKLQDLVQRDLSNWLSN